MSIIRNTIIRLIVKFAVYIINNPIMKDLYQVSGLFPMPELAYTSLDNAISSETLSFHHGKHLKAYVDNLNKLLPGSGLDGLSLSDIVRKSSGPLFNNAGQVLNHALYFSQFSTNPNPMSNNFKSIIESTFGSVDSFMKEFELKGVTLFGSGWVWLSADNDGRLVITQQKNAENPVIEGLKPLLTFDVWEHAYYLDFQNRRADQLAALWQYVDWSEVESRMN